jgi:hydrogenase expression/formation protein HypE
MTDELNISGWTCPIPLKNYPTIVMGHGSGGKMMSDLIKHMFLPLFDSSLLSRMGDSAVLELPVNGAESTRLAFSTDSFVVSPLLFPGGNIGELAVHGTVNDLAMSGAKPAFLSAGFILEEGLSMDLLGEITTSLANACKGADVELVAGDTKVVNKGHGDGLYINTTGIGVIPPGVNISPDQAKPGDVILVNGTLGDHGMAIMSVREGLSFETEIVSDSAPLHGLVSKMLETSKDIHCLRDATRGGFAAALNELAVASNVGIVFEETEVPVLPAVRSACEMLGLDPFYVANEGKLVAILPEENAEAVLESMREHPFGKDAALVGRVVEDHPGMVLAKTSIGGSRVVDLPAGELLPRIC